MKEKLDRALRLWSKKEYELSEELYRDIIVTHKGSDETTLLEVHMQFAGLLAAQDKDDEALSSYQHVMDRCDENQNITDLQFAMVSYFYSEQLCKMKRYRKVIEHTETSLMRKSSFDTLLCMLRALALYNLAKLEESRVTACQAINLANDTQQKKKITKRLQKEMGTKLEAE